MNDDLDLDAWRKTFGSSERMARALGICSGRVIRFWLRGREPHPGVQTLLKAADEVPGVREWLMARADAKPAREPRG
jgi:hypothetical protein